MSTKNMVLKTLEQNRGKPVSGSMIAKKLNVSRGAVWKAIEALRDEGYKIEAVTNRGYILSEESDLLSKEGIFVNLKNSKIKGDQIYVFSSLDSTNQLAKKMAIDGAPHGTVVLADEQTKGRGRRGRSFYSPKGTGIYLSIILKTDNFADIGLLVTTAASVAVCRALAKIYGVEAKIKWVNDIYLNDRKLCGILTEAITNFETGTIDSIVLGIGLNFKTTDFPEELNQTATSLFSSDEEIKDKRNRLAAAIIDEVLDLCEDLNSEKFISEYKQRSMVIGKDISVYRGNDQFDAKAIDIDSQGGLVVQKQDGTVEVLNSGEITVRFGGLNEN